jgi:hypothetical protein
MSSFSCPHWDEGPDDCRKLRRACVPGRPGCVLRDNSVFAVPAEERVRERDRERAGRESERLFPKSPLSPEGRGASSR